MGMRIPAGSVLSVYGVSLVISLHQQILIVKILVYKINTVSYMSDWPNYANYRNIMLVFN